MIKKVLNVDDEIEVLELFEKLLKFYVAENRNFPARCVWGCIGGCVANQVLVYSAGIYKKIK